MRNRLFVVAALGAVLVTACGGAASPGVTTTDGMASEPMGDTSSDVDPSEPMAPDESEVPGSDSATSSDAEPPPEALAALDFRARTVGGGTIDGTDYAGGKTVLWIWAPWCPQCNREAPNVAAAMARFGTDLDLIGIAGKDTDAEHEAFVRRHDLAAIPHAIDEDGSLWAKYGVGYQPAWVFIAEDGATRVVAGGLYDDLEPTLEDFLNS